MRSIQFITNWQLGRVGRHGLILPARSLRVGTRQDSGRSKCYPDSADHQIGRSLGTKLETGDALPTTIRWLHETDLALVKRHRVARARHSQGARPTISHGRRCVSLDLDGDEI